MAATPDGERRGWFAVPGPVRELFRRFPVRVHPCEALPARAPSASAAAARPRLYVFAGCDDDAARGRPSHNPSCLKWQTYLRIAGVRVDLVPSNNHASPSGALPFLLLPPGPTPAVPLTGSKIAAFARAHAPRPLAPDAAHPKADAYLALIAQNIRPAWLHALYLVPDNEPLLDALYLPPSPLLRRPLLASLRAAAAQQVLAATRRPAVDPPLLLAAAADAFAALSTALAGADGAGGEWFFGADQPGLFDAEVFAYTHLILGGAGLQWRDDALARCLAAFPALVAHRTALYRRCWGE